eukprot:s992_g3.t1
MKRATGIQQHYLLLQENLVRIRRDRPHSGQAAVTVMVRSVDIRRDRAIEPAIENKRLGFLLNAESSGCILWNGFC